MPSGTRDAIIQLCPRDVIEEKYKRRTAHLHERNVNKHDDVVVISPELMEVKTKLNQGECDRLLQEMESAYITDQDCHQRGKPAMQKLQLVDKVLIKLKNQGFARIFLDKGGLEHINNFIKKLPDGSFPLSNQRKNILQAILRLPCTEHHLKFTRLGKTLSALENSNKELDDNVKLIHEIKDKWSRIVSGVNMEYNRLETFEKENSGLMKKKPKRASA